MTAIETIAARLRQLSHAVPEQRWSEFSMRVPADPERDADLVLSKAADLIDAQAREIDRLLAFYAADSERMDWMAEHMIEVDWTMVKGCRCGGCNTFRITGFDNHLNDVVIAENESLRDAIDEARAKVLEPSQ